MKKKLSVFVTLLLFATVPTLLVWLPFAFNLETVWGIPMPRAGMGTVVSNYDGPLYIVIAKTLYNLDAIRANYSFPLPLEYYAAHFPLFPLLIKVFGPLITHTYSMLAVTVASSFLTLMYFRKLASEYVKEDNLNFLTFVFAIFPARWLIVRSIGSPEPLFIAAIIASLYYFKKEKYLWAGVWGTVAQFTKSPGILLFLVYILYISFDALKKSAMTSMTKILKHINPVSKLPLLLIPAALIAVFYLFSLTFGNFFAYFNSGDNIHLFFPPFQIFNYSQPWVNTFWLEEIIFIYLFGILGLLKLAEQKDTLLAWFVGVFLTVIIFVSHRDVLRYALPMTPFIIIAFREKILTRDFKIAIALLLIPIYLYTIVFISQNTMPISNWGPLL